jgi:hypothetical protein
MKENLALIGVGPVGFGFIFELARKLKAGQACNIASIDIFDKSLVMGAGLPYGDSAAPEHLFNIVTRIISVPYYDNFHKFIRENQGEISHFCQEIFEKRFRKKFERRFKIPYSPSAMEEPQHEEKLRLRQHYDRIWDSFQKRYLNLEVAETYHPRILFGIYASKMFHDAVKVIRSHGIVVNIHPQTEVTSLKREKDSQKLRLGFSGGEKRFDLAILATGRSLASDGIHSPRYITQIWPSEDMKENVERIIAAEIAKREVEGDTNKIIKIAIRGSSLSAIDVLKTIYRDGVFVEKADGNLIFIPDPSEKYEIHVDLVSRSNIMQGVKGKSKAMAEGGLKPDFAITQKNIEDLAKVQGGKVALWQVLLMFARSLEDAYRDNLEMEKAEQVKEIVKFIIQKVSRSEGSRLKDIDDDLLKIRGRPLQQLTLMQEMFDLALGEVDYRGIFELFQEKFFGKDPFSQLKDNLELAQQGDVDGGFLVLRDILLQFDSLELLPYLNPEEKALWLSPQFSRRVSSFVNAMPLQSAQEMMALREKGLIDYKALGYQAGKPYHENDKIVFMTEGGERLEYDLAINATGYNLDFRKNPSPLYASMIDEGLIDLDEEGRIKKKGLHADSAPGVIFANDGAIINYAFRRGIEIAEKYIAPSIGVEVLARSKFVGSTVTAGHLFSE